MIERKLDDIAMSTVDGLMLMEDMLINGYTWEEQAERLGYLLAKLSVVYELEGYSVKDLRHYTNAFNDWDAQAVDVAEGGPIWMLEGYDVVEATARRICHHGGKIALSHIGNHSDRMRFMRQIERDTIGVRYDPMPGMGRLELHDIQALREEAEQVELGKD